MLCLMQELRIGVRDFSVTASLFGEGRTAIVLGHVAAVVLAHRTAIAAYGEVRTANRSQWPLMALMVAYTMTSLWIIAQPIVSAGPR